MDHSQVDNIINLLCGKKHLTIVSKYEYKIAGDLHAQHIELQSIFKYGGYPPQSNYLFLGNFVGCQQPNYLDSILLLLALKIKYPTNIYLVKGNLDAGIPRWCVDEVDGYVSDSRCILDDCLKSLPVAALINDKIICTHGGLSPELHHLDQIRQIKKPTDVPHSRLLLDLLGPHSRRQCCVDDIFVTKEVQFLEKYDLRLICCGLQQVVSNYKNFAARRVVSISPAFDQPEYHNAKKVSDVAMMSLDENLKFSFHDLRYEKPLWSYHISNKAATIQSECSSGDSLARGTKLARWMNKPNSGNGASTSKSESSLEVDYSMIKPAAKYRTVSPEAAEVKRAERASKSNFGSGTRTPASKYRSNSPESTHAETKSGSNASKFDFDPASLYRSKSPGVKRFIGARV